MSLKKQRQPEFSDCLFHQIFVLFSGGGVDYGRYLSYHVGRKSTLGGVFSHHLFIWSIVNAIDFVPSHIAMHPLDLGSHLGQYSTGSLGDSFEFCRAEVSRSGDLSFDDIFWHGNKQLIFTYSDWFSVSPVSFKN